MSTKAIVALNIVFDHWIKEENKILQKARQENACHSFISNRKKNLFLQDLIRFYWGEIPIAPESPFIEEMDGEPISACPKCKKHILKVVQFYYEEHVEIWTRCENYNCKYIPMRNCIYINL